MNARVWFVACLLLFSGMCALIYQVAWLREFRLVFGGSTAASAAVLAIFMGGLGFGNLLLGRFVDRHPRPLQLYAWLEVGIALACAVSPFLIDLSRAFYTSVGGQEVLGVTSATLLRLLLATLVLAIPTLLMGGTLPAAAKAVTSAQDVQRRGLSLVYGLNTLGAVLGSLLSTFWLLQAFGTRTTLWIACVVNLLIAALAWRNATATWLTNAAADTKRQRKQRRKEGEEVTPVLETSEQPAVQPLLVYLSALLVGCLFFLMEMVWYRMLAPLLGGTTYTFGLILALALTGIGIGGLLYGALFRQRRPTAASFATSCAIMAVCLGVPYALGDNLALLANSMQAYAMQSFSQAVSVWALLTAIVVLPASIVSGLQFPILISLLGRGDEHVARQVGNAFAWNTVGCILGSLLGGFGLLPMLSAPGVWACVVITLSLLALGWVAVHSRFASLQRWMAVPVVASGVAFALMSAAGPTAVWRHGGIGAGRGGQSRATAQERQEWMQQMRHRLVWEAEGVESSIAITCDNSLAFFVNGKSDGNAIGDASTQIMLGMVGAALHPEPRQALVVGLGTGETAGWLAAIPDMQQVDVVELEPQVKMMAELCAPVNHNVLNNPKLRLIFNDARELLTTTPKRYDLIVSEPSNPYRAGVSSLFTKEFYQAAQQRLEADGLFCQWLQAYEIDALTVGLVMNTLQTVFPAVEVWQTGGGDMLLIGANQPIDYDVPRLRKRVSHEPFVSALDCSWRGTSLECLFSGYVGGGKLVQALAEEAGGTVNTDDNNQLEFAFARMVGKRTELHLSQYRDRAFLLGAGRPATHGGDVDWETALDLHQLMYVYRREPIPDYAAATSPQKLRALALNNNLAKNHAEAIRLWDSQPRPAQHSTELVVLTHSLLHLKDPRANEYIDRLEKLEPIEADSIRAVVALANSEFDNSRQLVIKSMQGLRQDPWPRFIGHLCDLALSLGQQNPATAQELFDNMSTPFCLFVFERERSAIAPRLHQLATQAQTPAAP